MFEKSFMDEKKCLTILYQLFRRKYLVSRILCMWVKIRISKEYFRMNDRMDFWEYLQICLKQKLSKNEQKLF